MGDEPKMVIQVDNKELMDFFESWLEDFKRVSEGMLDKINVDRGATLKIPEGDFRKLKMLTEALDGVAKKKFGFENAPDFSPMIASMKRLEACIEKIYIPEEIEVKMPNIEFPAIPAPTVDFTPLLSAFQDLGQLMKQGISASITNFDQMPMVFDKTIGGAGGTSGGGDATEATLQSILSALADVVTNTAAISIDADSVNLNTDTLEALLATTNTRLATLAGAVAGTEFQVDVLTMPTVAVTGTFWQATQPVSIASLPELPAGNNNIGDVDVATLPAVHFQDVYVTGQGSQTALNQNVILASAGTGSYDTLNGTTGNSFRSVSLEIVPAAGTVTAGVISFEGSNDNTNFVAVFLADSANVTAIPVSTVTLAASTPRYFIGSIPFRYFRARISTGITGTTTGVQCFSVFSTVPYSSPRLTVSQATAASLNATVTGTVATTMAANATTTPAKARDGAAGASDTGIPAFFVRRDTPTAVTPAVGDYELAQISANGEQWVRLAGELADDAAFTPGTTRVVPVGYTFDDSATDSVDEGDIGAARMSANRNQYMQIRDAAGNERGANVNASNEMLVALSSVPSHAVTNAGTFATQATLQAGTAYAGKVRLTDGTTDTDVRDLTNSNALNVAIVDGSGDQITTFGGGSQYTEGDTDASITGTAMMWEDTSDTLRAVSAAKPLPVNIVAGSAAGTEYTEDAASAANPAGGALILIREDARAGGLTTTDGDNVAARGNNKGELYVKTTDSDALLTTIDADTSNISTKIDTIAGAVAGTEMQVDVLTMPTITVNAHAVTNAGTFVVQENGAALTALQLIDDTVATLGTSTYSEATTKGLVMGAVRRDADTTLVDTTNEIAPLQVNAAGQLKVALITALPAGSAAIGKLAANAGVTIGAVEIAASQTIAVTNAGTFAAQATAVGTVADDATTPGAPVMIGGWAKETDGTDPGSVSAEDDVTRIITDRNRRMLVNDMHPNSFVLFENHTTAQTNNQLKAAPGAGLSIYITDIIFSNGATAGSIKLVEDEGGTPVQIGATVYMAVNGGAVMNFKTPKRLTANKSLGFTSTTVTTHTVEIHGYIAP